MISLVLESSNILSDLVLPVGKKKGEDLIIDMEYSHKLEVLYTANGKYFNFDFLTMCQMKG